MERKGNKDCKPEHKSKDVDSDKEKSGDEMGEPEFSTGKKEIPKQDPRSAMEGKAEKVSHKQEANDPQLEVNIQRGQRKRRASPLEDTESKKPSLSLETKPTPSEVHPPSGSRKRQASPLVVAGPKKPALQPGTAQALSEADDPDVLMRGFQNLDIDESERPRSRREVLVHRERSGYLNAQAAFRVPEEAEPDEMGEGAAGSSGEGAAGSSGEGAAGSSGEGGAGGSLESFPRLIIPIYWIQEMHAEVISRYNETMPQVEEELALYRNMVQDLRDYEDQMGGEYYTLLFNVAPLVRELMESESCKRERIRAALEMNMQSMQAEMIKCTGLAKTVMKIFSADGFSPMSTQLNENPRHFMRELDRSLVLLDSFRDLCKIEANEYNKQRYSMNQEEVAWPWG